MTMTQSKIDELVESANSFFDKRNLIESLVEYSRAIDQFDLLDKYYKVQKHEILVRCAVCYDLLGNFTKSEIYVNKALELIPNVPFLLLYKAVLLLVNGLTEKANLMLIKYKQITMGKCALTYETFRLLFYYIMELDHPVLLKEINEIANVYPLNSILLLLRASVNLKIFYTKYPEMFAYKDEFCTFNANDNSKITVNDLNIINNTQSTFRLKQSKIIEKENSNKRLNEGNNIQESGGFDNINNFNKEKDKKIKENEITKLKDTDSNYIQFKSDINEINTKESKETAEFLLREGISVENLTKLYFLSVPEMEEVEPKKLINYKSLFTGLKVFYVIFKAIKLLKVKILKKRLKTNYSNQIKQASISKTENNSSNLNAVEEFFKLEKSTDLTKENTSSNTYSVSNLGITNNFASRNNSENIIKDLKSEYEEKVLCLFKSPFFNNINLTRKEVLENSSFFNLNTSISNLNNVNNSNFQNNQSKKSSSNSNNNSAVLKNQVVENSSYSKNLKNNNSLDNSNSKRQAFIKERVNINFFSKNKYYCNSNLNKKIIKYYNQSKSGDNSLLFKTNQTYSNHSHNTNKKMNNSKQNINIQQQQNIQNPNYNNLITNNILENIKIVKKNNKNIMIENNQEKVRFTYSLITIIKYYNFLII
jgi:hypothetical protein